MTRAALGLGLAEFIDTERIAIVAEWETFARSLAPPGGMTAVALRDHAHEILTAVVGDMKSRQTDAEQAEKSKGRGSAQRLEEIGRIHAVLRIENGFKLGEIVAEYRALRASVLRLWEDKSSDPGGVTRFNEAVDEALTEAVAYFMKTTEHFRDQSLGILGHDLRNPLSAIIMGATVLVAAEKLDDKSVRIASRMLSSGKRMNRMIDDLLDLTRTRFGDRIPIVRQPVDLATRLPRRWSPSSMGSCPRGPFASPRTATCEESGTATASRRCCRTWSAMRSSTERRASPSAWSPRAEPMRSRWPSATRAPPSPGARPSAIFEPMVRHVGDKRTNEGLGLGLYIAAQIVLSHGGTLDVTSTDADGTTFTVSLPRLAPRAR